MFGYTFATPRFVQVNEERPLYSRVRARPSGYFSRGKWARRAAVMVLLLPNCQFVKSVKAVSVYSASLGVNRLASSDMCVIIMDSSPGTDAPAANSSWGSWRTIFPSTEGPNRKPDVLFLKMDSWAALILEKGRDWRQGIPPCRQPASLRKVWYVDSVWARSQFWMSKPGLWMIARLNRGSRLPP